MSEPYDSLKLNGRPTLYRCEAHWDWRPPPLPDYDCWCVLEGRGVLQLNGRQHQLEAGTCFVLQPGDLVHGSHDPRHRLLVFACHFTMDDDPQPLTGPVRTHDLPFLVALARECEAAGHRSDEFAEGHARLALRLLLLHLLAARRPHEAPHDPRIVRLYHAIREDPGQEWSVEVLAARANLSRSQLTRRFAAEIGMPPGRCVTRARIDRARQLLRESQLSMSQIADALGYRDLFYFSRQFKQLTGRSPTAYRGRQPRSR